LGPLQLGHRIFGLFLSSYPPAFLVPFESGLLSERGYSFKAAEITEHTNSKRARANGHFARSVFSHKLSAGLMIRRSGVKDAFPKSVFLRILLVDKLLCNVHRVAGVQAPAGSGSAVGVASELCGPRSDTTPTQPR
jgi:hypothetical protein